MRTSRLAAVATTLVATSALAACGSSSDEGGSSDSASGSGSESSTQFPVTIEHALGETTIEEKPERVAAVAWMNHEVPLALGVVPVGMSEAAYGDDDGDGVLPWVEERLGELDAETPVLFDETEGIDFEAVADTQPDVILASYSGLTQEEYDTLSGIAPVVAYPDVAWGTSVEDMVRLNSEAIGMAEEGEQLVEELDTTAADAFASHPDLEGKSAMWAFVDPNDLSQIGFYTTNDTRPAYLESLGMTTPSVVTEESEGSEEFYLTISAEEADRLADVDVIITYGDQALLEQMQADPLLSQIPAVERGSVALLEDGTPLAASANPTPLSIPFNLDEYLDVLASAAQKAQA